MTKGLPIEGPKEKRNPVDNSTEILALRRDVDRLRTDQITAIRELTDRLQRTEDSADDPDPIDLAQLVIGGKRVYVDRVGSGIRINAESDTFKSLFSLYGTTSTVLKVRGSAYAFCNAGAFSNIAAGTGISIDTNYTVTNNTYIYLEFVRSTPSIKIEVNVGATPAIPTTNSDTTERYPLWYIPWLSATSRIDWENVIDLRTAIHMEAMS